MALIEHNKGLRRRPLWEYELDTAKQQLGLQFGTKDLIGFGVEDAHKALRAVRLLQYVKTHNVLHCPIFSIVMENKMIMSFWMQQLVAI